MSVAESEGEDFYVSTDGSGAEGSTVSATELLAYDDESLVHEAALFLPLDVDDLQRRLQQVASTHDTSPEFRLPRSPSTSVVSTPPFTTVSDLEKSCHQELVRGSGRPACSIEEMSDILAAPMARYQAVQPWLTDEPDTEDGRGDLKTIFTRQFARWWDFHKSQWVSRGLGDTEGGLSAFLDASRRKYEGMGFKAMVSAPSFDETIQRQWERMPATLEKSEAQTFSAYSHAVKMRLAIHHFSQPLRLKGNPQKQNAWTEWLEYLSFELRSLEKLTRAAESLHTKFYQARKKLLKPRQPNGNKAARTSAIPDSAQNRWHSKVGEGTAVAKELAVARADRDACQQLIDDFIQETETYTQVHKAAFYQRHRVEWVVKEARIMENGSSLHRNTGNSKKRKERHEELSEPPSKRISKRVNGDNAHPVTASNISQTRRSTLRSARRGSAQD
ncbi:MAG: hypothetical protein Q9220_006221 [cf. Caloplaca sp. 1 TL-2023]